jgi:site-specific recombinase XerD
VGRVYTERSGPLEDVLAGFDRYLDGQRGCVAATRQGYRREARAFMVGIFADRRIEWAEVTAGRIAGFIGDRARGLSLVSRQNPSTAIRSFLRYLTGEGLIRAGIEGAVPPVGRSKHATTPRHVTPAQLESALSLCSGQGAGGMRDRAMLLVAARLGLRPGEVLKLNLRDLDWNRGSVLVRAGKTSRERLLPLPEDVGVALASYLQKARPASVEHAVFLSHVSPHKPVRSSSIVAGLVNRLLRQTGIGAPCTGAYVLRHTLATTMVRSGASFKEVADILGHSSLTTTGIYAKLDLVSLAQVALPWPGGDQ